MTRGALRAAVLAALAVGCEEAPAMRNDATAASDATRAKDAAPGGDVAGYWNWPAGWF